jgi:hypothetical protein
MRFALALIASLQFAAALGQVAVRGVVKDPSGATVVGATASVESHTTQGDAAPNAKQVWNSETGIDGMFSLALPQGQYKLCIAASGFQTNCTEFSVGDEPPTVLSVSLHANPNTGLAPSSVMDNRLRNLSGDRATDCGRVKIGDNAAEATACVLREFRNGQPFLVRYDVQGIDSEVSIGLVSDSHAVYTVAFDSFRTSPRGLPKGSNLMDGNHNVVLTCPVPVKLHVTTTGKVTCLSGGKKALALLGPNF